MIVLLRDAVRYALASACALAVDMGLLWLLVRYAGWWYLAAATASFVAGIGVAYALSVTLVFQRRRLRDRRAEFLSFAAIGAAGLAINAVVIWVAVKHLGLQILAAKCVAAAFTFTFNFIARRQLLFAGERTRPTMEPYGIQR